MTDSSWALLHDDFGGIHVYTLCLDTDPERRKKVGELVMVKQFVKYPDLEEILTALAMWQAKHVQQD